MPTQLAQHFRAELMRFMQPCCSCRRSWPIFPGATADGRARRSSATCWIRRPTTASALCAPRSTAAYRAGLCAGRMGGRAWLCRASPGQLCCVGGRWSTRFLRPWWIRFPKSGWMQSASLAKMRRSRCAFSIEDYFCASALASGAAHGSGRCRVGNSAEYRRKKARREPGSFACLVFQCCRCYLVAFFAGAFFLAAFFAGAFLATAFFAGAFLATAFFAAFLAGAFFAAFLTANFLPRLVVLLALLPAAAFLACGLSALRASPALLCGGLLCGLFGHNLFRGCFLGCSFLGRSLFGGFLCRGLYR